MTRRASIARISTAPTRRTPRASAKPSMRLPVRSTAPVGLRAHARPETVASRVTGAAAAPPIRGATSSTSTVSAGGRGDIRGCTRTRRRSRCWGVAPARRRGGKRAESPRREAPRTGCRHWPPPVAPPQSLRLARTAYSSSRFPIRDLDARVSEVERGRPPQVAVAEHGHRLSGECIARNVGRRIHRDLRRSRLTHGRS